MPERLVLGIDLAASPRRRSGVALLALRRGGGAELRLCRSIPGGWREAAELATRLGAALAVVDAPMSLPRRGGLRAAERLALKLGARLLPLTLASMKALASEARRLRRSLEAFMDVYETHPGSIPRVSGCPAQLYAARYGVDPAECRSRDKRDALLAALVGAGLATGETIILADDEGTALLLPRPGLCGRGAVMGSGKP